MSVSTKLESLKVENKLAFDLMQVAKLSRLVIFRSKNLINLQMFMSLIIGNYGLFHNSYDFTIITYTPINGCFLATLLQV